MNATKYPLRWWRSATKPPMHSATTTTSARIRFLIDVVLAEAITGARPGSATTSGATALMLTSTTITVMLSRPPCRFAAVTKRSAMCCGALCSRIISVISSSGTSSTRPSLHNIKRSPSNIGIVQVSTDTCSSIPSARVTILRRGWVRASPTVSRPSVTSSCTYE